MNNILKGSLLINFFNNYSKFIIAWFIFCLVFLFTYWAHPSLTPKISPDGYGYWSIAENFTSSIDDASIRPWFYPIFIRICMIISLNHWQIILSLFQIFFHSSVCILMYYLFRKYGLNGFSSFVCTLIIGFNPNLITYTTYILADLNFAILTTLAWYFVLKINERDNWNYRSIVFASLFCALALFTKPIALFMIFTFLISIYMVKGFSYNFIKISIFMLIINYSLFFSWKVFQSFQDSNPAMSQPFFLRAGAINWTAIKSGYVDIGDGTPLYNRLKELGKIEKARSLNLDLTYTMDESPDFVDVYRSIGGDVLYLGDQEFAKKIIKEMPIEIILLSLAKWHSFFTKRCFFPSNDPFPGMIDFIRKTYIKFYSYLYRPLLLIFLISSLIILYKKQYLNLLYCSFSLLLYASLIVTLGTGHSGEFIRYRVWVEYVMWFIALLPFGIVLEKVFIGLNKTKKIIYNYNIGK